MKEVLKTDIDQLIGMLTELIFVDKKIVDCFECFGRNAEVFKKADKDEDVSLTLSRLSFGLNRRNVPLSSSNIIPHFGNPATILSLNHVPLGLYALLR